MFDDFVFLSLVPLLVGVLASLSCALVGNFLVLRRQALIGDAVSHVVLPGIVMAFLVTGSVAAGPMLIGAGIAAVASVLLIELVRRVGRVEPGAAMGVVFTAMFAGGILLIERSDTSSVHLDVEHALYGNLESLVWFSGLGWSSLVDPAALARTAVLASGRAMRGRLWAEAKALAGLAETYARLAERGALLARLTGEAGWQFGTHDTAAPPAGAVLWLAEALSA